MLGLGMVSKNKIAEFFTKEWFFFDFLRPCLKSNLSPKYVWVETKWVPKICETKQLWSKTCWAKIRLAYKKDWVKKFKVWNKIIQVTKSFANWEHFKIGKLPFVGGEYPLEGNGVKMNNCWMGIFWYDSVCSAWLIFT